MRADNEQVFGDSMESLEDDIKPHQCSENNWEDAELKNPKNGKENARELFCDTRGDELDKENDGIMLGHSPKPVTDMMSDNQKEAHDNHLSAVGDSLEKEGSVFYMDKNVTACDLPQIVMCYKENTYHVVKDICVDEGVPVQEKFLTDKNDTCEFFSDQLGSEDQTKAEVNVNVLTAPVVGTLESKSLDISPVIVEEHSDFCSAPKPGSKSLTTHEDVKDTTDKKSERANNKPEIQESSTGNYADVEESKKCNQENLIVTGEVKGDANYTIIQDISTLDAHKICPQSDSEKHLCSRGEYENMSVKEGVKTAGITTKESLTLADIMSMEDAKKPFNHSHNGRNEQSSQESSGKRSLESAVLAPEIGETEDSKIVQVSPEEAEKAENGVANSSCAENADVTDHSSVSTSQESTKTEGPSKASHSGSEPGLRSSEPHRSEPEYYVPRHNHMLEDPYDHPFSSGGIGETSFSAAEPVSGHITYSGPIAFSGSLSVRSDASTTSTRSFAFPVLQAEWNSSPVRMAKADKRHHRRQKSWTHSLLCCRF